ncbi:Hypothetical protein NGAL_HAMBI2605_20360 [Neorhizobium galegae bv. orientalis]|nr:Hypothetical protein NGAL_HAMBI2605_20360 [Neorhizobium galegae bv. orientalis]
MATRCIVTKGISANDENATWIGGVLEGVLSAGGRIASVTTVYDMKPGSKGGLIQVVAVEKRG